VLATLKELFGLSDFLTRRDASAHSFASLFDEIDDVRDDTPLTVPRPSCRLSQCLQTIRLTQQTSRWILINEKY